MKPLVITCPDCGEAHELPKIPLSPHFVVLCRKCGGRLRVKASKWLAWWRVKVECRPRAS